MTLLTATGGPAAPAPADLIKDATDRSFPADVLEASRKVPVIVDFWATWCGPCKQLGPLLEKQVKAAKGAVRLVKVDVDRNQAIAAQLQVQSIPAVYAFFQGRPVDAFTGALPESQIKQFIDRLIRLGGAAGRADDPVEDALAQARQAMTEGKPGLAANIFGQIIRADPENAAAHAGLVRCHLAQGDLRKAKQMSDRVPAQLADDKEIVAARGALALAEEGRSAGSVGDLKKRLGRDPADLQVRFDLALAYNTAGQREAAVDELLEIVQRDREWEDQKARKQLVKFFEAYGHTDKVTVSARRRLSSILFS